MCTALLIQPLPASFMSPFPIIIDSFNKITWNSTDSFFSIQSVIWVTVTCLAPTLGFATRVNLGFPLNPYLIWKNKTNSNLCRHL